MKGLPTIAAVCGLLRTAVAVVACSVAASAAADQSVRVETVPGAILAGPLRSIDRDTLELVVDGEPRRIPLADVRTLTGGENPDGPLATDAVEVVGARGLVLRGDDFRWEDGRATLVRGADAIELPIERVQRVALRPPGDAAGGGWLAAVPAEPAADLVAVSGSDGFELVECAIAAVSPATVTVVLDGDRIAVNRSKVLGLVWARPPTDEAAQAAPVTAVAVDGGAVGAAVVEYRDGRLVLDGAIRVPGGWLRSIDFAAGRTVALAAIEPETSSSEPFFADLSRVEGLAAFFAPRIVAPDDGLPAWLLRPRATATWRVPAGSRRFRSRAVRSDAASAAAVVVWARADDGPEWRERLEGPAAVSIELDVRDARRLTIGVEFAADGAGAPVRLDDAGFEK